MSLKIILWGHIYHGFTQLNDSDIIIISSVYEVYRGYIVFVFSITMFVCWCVNFFCVKGFSGTIAPRILKFGTNVEYDLLYCVKENQPPAAYHSIYLSIFLSLQ